MTLAKITIEALDQAEDHLILAAMTDEGVILGEEDVARLFSIPAEVIAASIDEPANPHLVQLVEKRQNEIKQSISERNAKIFEAEADKLDGWAEDVKLSLEREIKDLDRRIREAKRASKLAPTLEGKLTAQKQIKALESQRNQRRRTLFEQQDEIDVKRESLIKSIEGKLQQKTLEEVLFTLRWRVV